MFFNNINPVLFDFGVLQIRYYGIIYALGFIITILFLKYFVKKKIIKINLDDIYDLVFYILIGVVVGARVFEVLIWEPAYYFANPLKIFALWEGGLSFHGSVVGASIGILYFCKKRKFTFYQIADLIVIPAALGTAFGRIGNYLNSELYGIPSNVPWCVVFERVDDVCRHPYQIYSFVARMIIFSFLLYLLLKTKSYKKSSGLIFWTYILLSGIARMVVDIFRESKPEVGQALSFLMLLISAFFIIKSMKYTPKSS